MLTDKTCKSLQKLLVSVKIYVDSWWSCNVWYHCYKAIKLFESEIYFCHEILCLAAILKGFSGLISELYILSKKLFCYICRFESHFLYTLPRKPLCRFVSFEPTPVHVYPVRRVYPCIKETRLSQSGGCIPLSQNKKKVVELIARDRNAFSLVGFYFIWNCRTT